MTQDTPAEIGERIKASFEMSTTSHNIHRFTQVLIAVDQLVALAQEQAPRGEAGLTIPDECAHLIVFDDADRSPLMFASSGAKEAAMKTWERISMQWNAHLFVCIAHNARDVKLPPCAVVAPPTPEQAAPSSEWVEEAMRLSELVARAHKMAGLRAGEPARRFREEADGHRFALRAHLSAAPAAAAPSETLRILQAIVTAHETGEHLDEAVDAARVELSLHVGLRPVPAPAAPAAAREASGLTNEQIDAVWLTFYDRCTPKDRRCVRACIAAAAAPAAALTDAQIAVAVRPLYASDRAAAMGLPDDVKTARAIEAAHGIGIPQQGTKESSK